MLTRLFVAALALGALSQSATAQPKTVAITAIVEHPALNAVRDGVKEGLARLGHREGADVRFVFQSAQGAQATAVQIARQFIGERPSVIVAISTPSAQSVAAATRDIPLVFSAVTDPLGAQLVKSLQAPGGNVTGISDMTPVAEQLSLIREITPHARRIGVLYNPGEPNSVTSVKMLQDAAAQAGVTIVEGGVTRSADAQAAARALVGKVDALYIPTDNTIVSAFEAVVGIAQSAKLPLYSGDTESVARGAIASVGFNYFEVGIQTGSLVSRILKGEAPGAIPVAFASGTDLHINRIAAHRVGVSIPESVSQRATKVIE